MGEGGRMRPAAAIVVALALVLTACGARLTDEQRLAGIGAGPGGGGGSIDGGPGGFDGDGFGDLDGIGDGGPGTGPGGPAGGPGTGPGGPGTGPGAGTGGATDVGVTPTSITIATISDVSGVQPGLFRSTWQAMQALVAMVNSQGGIHGRQLDLMLLDSKTDAGANRVAVAEACDKAFALVGSMSAFDNGGAAEVDRCEIPDMSAITTTAPRIRNQFTHPIYPNRPDRFILGSGTYMAQRYPQASKRAAQLWLNAATTRSNAEAKRVSYIQGANFDFIFTRETQVVTSSYTPHVQAMKDAGVEFVTMLANWQAIAQLTQAMANQRWRPEVLEWDSVAYSPEFIRQTRGSAEGSYIYINTAMIEEINQNPEMQLYAQWLARVAPGADPEYFGLYAWSAGRLFVELVGQIGPDLTRDKLMQAIRSTNAWDGNGLHASHDIGRRLPSNCIMFVKIENDRFVRNHPASGWDCSTPLHRLS